MFRQIFQYLLLVVLAGRLLYAVDYYKECDFNGNGKIDTRKTYQADGVPKEIAKKETRCRSDLNLAKSEEELAKGKEKLTKLAKILALLSPKELEKEIERMSKEIENEKDPDKKKRMEERLTVLKEARVGKTE